MTDNNSELVARLARRPEVEDFQPSEAPVAVYHIHPGDWNAPIDATQADSMSNITLFQGWIAELKEQVWRWEPRPCPPIIDLPETEEIPRGRQ